MSDQTPGLQSAWQMAAAEAAASHHEFIEPGHLWIALCRLTEAAAKAQEPVRSAISAEQRAVAAVLQHAQASESEMISAMRMGLGRGAFLGGDRRKVSRSPDSRIVFMRAQIDGVTGPLSAVRILAALLADAGSPGSQWLCKQGADLGELLAIARREAGKLRVEPAPPQAAKREAKAEPSLLSRFGKDLTALAKGGLLVECIGRDAELLQMIQALARETRSNPLLVGDPGVGKTALVEGLAWRIAHDRDRHLKGMRIVEITFADLVAGTTLRGELEARVTALLREAAAPDVVLFIDEIHSLVASRGSPDVGSMLKPALARGEIRCIGATTWDEYQRHIEGDPALERRFQVIRIDEPSAEDAIAMIERGFRARFERKHKVRVTADAIEAAVRLSAQFIRDRFLPDKAIDLLDQACARAAVPNLGGNEAGSAERTVTGKDVAATIAEWKKIPVAQPDTQERSRLLGMTAALGRRVIGQDAACEKVAEMILRARAGLKAPERPVAVLLFVGRTGLGKTELAKATAEFLSGEEREALVRLDMSEYMEKHSVSRLIGAPPGYLGFDEEPMLTGALRRRPHCVVLIDEVEKAHPEVLNLFLQLFEEGRLTDARGRVAHATEAVFILTSNVVPVERALGFGARAREGGAWRGKLLEVFRPELLNRIDAVIPFCPLDREDLVKIVRLLLAGVERRLAARGFGLRVERAAVEWLAAAGDDGVSGARALRRAVEQQVEAALSPLLLRREFAPGSTVVIDASEAGLVFSKANAPTQKTDANPAPH